MINLTKLLLLKNLISQNRPESGTEWFGTVLLASKWFVSELNRTVIFVFKIVEKLFFIKKKKGVCETSHPMSDVFPFAVMLL